MTPCLAQMYSGMPLDTNLEKRRQASPRLMSRRRLRNVTEANRNLGTTGRTFRTRYREHVQAIRTNKINSKYAQHILDTQHTYGSIENTMSILHMATKGRYTNTLEKFHFYNISKKGIHINKTYSDLNNPICEVLIKTCSI
jgi:hypothetical protein